MSTATLNGHRVTHARVNLPAWGVWWAEVSLDEEVTLAGAVSLAVADLVLSGTIIAGGPSKGRSSYRIAGGAGAWGKSIPSKSYANDAGVKLSTILVDAVTACGESIDATTISGDRVGPSFVREEGPAARILELYASEAWYVGEDGVTRLGKRPVAPLADDAPRVVPVDLARGTVTLAADSIASIVPGVQVDGLEAVDVMHALSPDGLRSMIWGAGSTPTSGMLASLALLVAQLDPDRRFRGVFEYRVVTTEGNRLNLQPVRVSIKMPSLLRVPVRPGVAGCRADVALGSRVIVGFIDGSPARPYVAAFEDADGEGFVPDRLDLVGEDDTIAVPGTETGRAVRYGDVVMMPAGPVATPIGVVLLGAKVGDTPAPIGPFSASRVRP